MDTRSSSSDRGSPDHADRFADLCVGRASHVHVRGFLDDAVAGDLTARVTAREPLEEYRNVPGMGKIGFALAEVSDKPSLAEYLRWGIRFDGMMDGLLTPNPFRRIRALLEELWPPGIVGASLRGHAFPTGVVRRHQSGWHGESVHIDCPPSLILEQTGATSPLQIGVVCYASACEEGGALQIWSDIELDEQGYHERCRAAGVERLDASVLGSPAVTIEPKPGDVVAFRTAHPHAVTTIARGRRVSFGFFVAATGPDRPLLAWA